MSTETLSYGDHALQTVTIHRLPKAHKDAHWVVYVHHPPGSVSQQS